MDGPISASDAPRSPVEPSHGRHRPPVRLFGPTLAIDDVPLHLRSRKARLLVACLALKAGQAVSRQQLRGWLWPGFPNPAGNLDVELHHLRKVNQLPIVSHGHMVLVEWTPGDVDALAFDLAVKAALEEPERAADELTFAVDLRQAGKGALLAGIEPQDQLADLWDWLQGERAKRERQYAHALLLLAHLALGRQDWHEAERLTTLCLRLFSDGLVWDYAVDSRFRSLAGALGVPEPAFQAPSLEEEARLIRTMCQRRRSVSRWASPVPAESTPRNTPPVPEAVPLAALPHLYGRDEDIEGIQELILASSLHWVVLSGPPGVGKTELSRSVGARLQTHFSGGACFVDLSNFTEPDLVPAAIRAGLGLPPEGEVVDWRYLARRLREFQGLLILDNIEQLVDQPDPSPTIDRRLKDFLAGCPGLRLLVTSRKTLQGAGWEGVEVKPLPVPSTDEFNEIQASPAVALFVERAQLQRSDFALSQETAPTIASICRTVEGLPLALILSAAWVRDSTLTEVEEELQTSLSRLEGHWDDLPAGQRTMSACIERSYRLLPEEQKVLFLGLGVFPGGCNADSVARVCCPEVKERSHILFLLRELIIKNLLLESESSGAGQRYSMLHCIRLYAAEVLQKDEVQEGILRNRHLDCVLERVRKAYDDGPHWSRRVGFEAEFQVESRNTQAALGWALRKGQVQLGLELSAKLTWFWDYGGNWDEGVQWLSAFLGLPGSAAHPHDRALALVALCHLEIRKDQYGTALAAAQEALSIWTRETENGAVAYSRMRIGECHRGENRLDEALDWYRSSRALALEIGDKRQAGAATAGMVQCYIRSDNDTEVEVWYPEGLRLLQEAKDWEWMAKMYNDLSIYSQKRRDFTSAAIFCASAYRLMRRWGAVDDTWRPFTNWGDMHRRLGIKFAGQGNTSQADVHLKKSRTIQQKCLAFCQEYRLERGTAHCLLHLGIVDRIENDYVQARIHLEEALSIFQGFGGTARLNVGACHLELGSVEEFAGDLIAARDQYERASEVFQTFENRHNCYQAIVKLVAMAERTGDYSRTRRFLVDTLRLMADVQWSRFVGGCLLGLAAASISRQDYRLAAQLLGLRVAYPVLDEGWFPVLGRLMERCPREACEALGTVLYEEQFQSGRRLGLAHVIALLGDE